MQTTLSLLLLSLPLALTQSSSAAAPAGTPATSQPAALIVPAGGLHPNAAAQAAHASELLACSTYNGQGAGFCEQTAIGWNSQAASYLAGLAPDVTVSAAIASLSAGNVGPSGLSALVDALKGEPSSLQGLVSSVVGNVASLQGPVDAKETGASGSSSGGSAGSSGSAGAAGSSGSKAAAPGPMQTGAVMAAGVMAGMVGLVVGL